MPGNENTAARLDTLSERLAARIRREGPITFHEWMKAALYDENAGYYNRTDLSRWGREGDYRTSPERSELFAATFARYFAHLFEHLGRPAEWTIVECGAGDGSFAEGVLRALENNYPQVFAATLYCIDEISSSARWHVSQRLQPFGQRVIFAPIESLPQLEPGAVFANELLDAFPVHRLGRRNGEVFEFYVTTTSHGRFEWTDGPVSDDRLLDFCRTNAIEIAEGQIVEVSLEIDTWFATVAAKLGTGYVITVDYGDEAASLYATTERREGTLRAYSRHSFVDVLEHPGEHDITSTIDWTRVRATGALLGFETVKFERQDRFLIEVGLLKELERRLNELNSDSEKLELSTSAREMILPGSMASSFQVLVQKRSKE